MGQKAVGCGDPVEAAEVNSAICSSWMDIDEVITDRVVEA
jgi:hypothetical protein